LTDSSHHDGGGGWDAALVHNVTQATYLVTTGPLAYVDVVDGRYERDESEAVVVSLKVYKAGVLLGKAEFRAWGPSALVITGPQLFGGPWTGMKYNETQDLSTTVYCWPHPDDVYECDYQFSAGVCDGKSNVAIGGEFLVNGQVVGTDPGDFTTNTLSLSYRADGPNLAQGLPYGEGVECDCPVTLKLFRTRDGVKQHLTDITGQLSVFYDGDVGGPKVKGRVRSRPKAGRPPE
jgi:hypothetical protein